MTSQDFVDAVIRKNVIRADIPQLIKKNVIRQQSVARNTQKFYITQQKLVLRVSELR